MKVISGGQTGVDQAALRAAKAAGIETGGWMPKGFRTLAGPRPEFAAVFDSMGEKCTAKAIANVGNPSFDIHLASLPPIKTVVDWIYGNAIHVLNVAGNSEMTAPGIGRLAYAYLLPVFHLWKLIGALEAVMDPSHIEQWLTTPNAGFNGSTPIEVIERGEAERVWRVVYQLESGVPG